MTRYGLSLREEAQLLYGSGVGNNLGGLMQGAPVFVDGTSGATKIDVLRRAAADLELAGYAPSGIVLNPVDWSELELTKDSQGRYVIAIPRGSNPAQLWSLPVVSSPSMNLGSYLIGDYQQAATLYDRWVARVEVNTSNEDDFVKNMVTIRAESRLALATHTPAGMRKGVFP